MRSWSAVSRRFAAVSAVASLAVIGACAESGAPITGPEVRGVVQALVAGTVYACVDGGPGTVSAAAGIFVVNPGSVGVVGSPTASSNVAIAAGTCQQVASANSSNGYTTFDITLASPGYELVSVSCVTGIAAPIPDCEGATVTTTANQFHGTVVNYVVRQIQVAGCTLTQGYWKNHEEDVTPLINASNEASPYILDGKLVISYGADGVAGGTGANADWTVTAAGADALMEQSSKNYTYALAQQLIAAELNILNGATASAAVLTAITQAQLLISGGVTDAEKAAASTLVGILTTFNEGDAAGSSGHCDDAPVA
ncbi:MAG TPA: hypothetical protein VM939_14270 [Gemmatimonadaceae bacterium]|nr:hypothetical protein [Gemmatimonadaceae bacterium]